MISHLRRLAWCFFFKFTWIYNQMVRVLVVSWYGQSWTGSMRSKKKFNYEIGIIKILTSSLELNKKTIYRFRFFTKHDHMYVSSCLHCFLYFIFFFSISFGFPLLFLSLPFRFVPFLVVRRFFFKFSFSSICFVVFFSYCKSGLLFWSRHFIFMHSYLIWCYIYLALWPLNVPEIE